ncbi:MAG: hypothetical protein ACLSUW_03455 [Akkermansia sp.]
MNIFPEQGEVESPREERDEGLNAGLPWLRSPEEGLLPPCRRT